MGIGKKARRFIMRFDGKAFCNLMNLANAYSRQEARFSFDQGKGLFAYYDKARPNDRLAFSHKDRAFVYQRGPQRRFNTLWSEYLLARVPFEPGDTVIDVGANIGEIGVLLNKKFPALNYLAYEPSQAEFRCLEENCPFGTLRNVGLWDSDGELEFFVAAETADSSLIRPSNFSQTVKVPVRRLDSEVDGPVKLLKLEAEGAEPEIALGMGEKIRNVHYIAADVGFERGVKQESTFAPVVNYLTGKGFEVVDIGFPRMTVLFRNTALK
ncbi:MAG: FkbM family methyltransferase [Rhizobiaceae bacterium]